MDQALNQKIDAYIAENKEQLLQDIAALVADREAGTQGPWVAESWHVQQNGQLYYQITDGSDAIMQNQFCWCQGSQDANARRIARVPDMEAALIAQDAELKRLREALETIRDKRGQCNRAVDCRAVARTALGEKP
jgi:hypothetical protein